MAPKRQPVASGAATSTASPSITSPTTAVHTQPSSTATGTLSPKASVAEITQHIWKRYLVQTSQRTFLLDAFMAYLVLVGGIQFVYCVVAGNYPFNAFLAGFSAAVGQFVLTASLRMQTSSAPSSTNSSKGKSTTAAADNQESTPEVSHERAFADYIFGSLILHFFCINFIN